MKLLQYFHFIFFYSQILLSANLNSILLESENEYNVQNIPISILNENNAVIRKKHTIFEVYDNENAIMKVIYAVTIFNRQGNEYGELVLLYDNNLIEIDDLEGKIFDKLGNEIRDLNDNDIKDYSAYKGYTLYDENRVKYINLYYNEYPYTVEFAYEINYNGFISWPSWYSQETLDAVESSRFEVKINEKEDLRYWCNSDSIHPIISYKDGKKSYVWETKNQSEMSVNLAKSDLSDITTHVKIAPNNFGIEGYSGNMQTWENFGLWFHNLSKGRTKLPELAEQEIRELVKNINNKKEQAKLLYEYLQSKIRYVSVQLGIGGWQPFDANYVYERGYGDCKALSNYMISLLKFINITSYPVLINSGNAKREVVEEFPSNQFNHVIVCIPFEEDSVWLECTSQFSDFGFIESENENRLALLVKPDGGKLVRTPKTTSLINQQKKNIYVNLAFGTAIVNCESILKGNQLSGVKAIFEYKNSEEEEKWIKNQFTVPEILINDYEFKNNNTGEAIFTLNVKLPRYANISGKRIFFNPNLMERKYYVPDDNEERVTPIRFSYPYLDIDSIKYLIPSTFEVESLPQNKNLTTSFGNFKIEIKNVNDSVIVYTRILEISDYSIPPEKYNEYRDFYAQITDTDKKKIVLVKK